MSATKVFVSATWPDLFPEREALAAVINQSPDFQFHGMEELERSDATTPVLSLTDVAETSVYIGLVGGRYGSGLTAAEYNRAHELGLFSLLYFKKEAAIPESGRDAGSEKRAQLAALKTELRQHHLISEFTDPADLAAQVLADLQEYASKLRAPGNIVAATHDLRAYRVQTGIKAGDLVRRFLDDVPLRPRPTPLRPDVSRFGGLLDRAAEINQIKLALQAGQRVGIYGPAGIGKTALLRHLAHQPLDENYPDGVLYLGPLGDTPAADILQFIFESFFESDRHYRPRQTDLPQLLNPKRALILLDDVRLPFQELQTVLDSAPHCGFVLAAPTRDWLGNLRALPLAGLPPEEAVSLLERTLERPLHLEERAAAQSICVILAGHPLHLEQAATLALYHGWSLTEVAAKMLIGQPIEMLTKQTLLDATKAEQQVLVALGALGGAAVRAEALAGLTGLAEIAAVLLALQERQLIEERRTGYALNGDLNDWLEQLGDLSAWRRHALSYFSQWAEERQALPQRVAEAAPALLYLFNWASQQGQHEALMRLAQALDAPLTLTGQWASWKRMMEQVQQSARAQQDRPQLAWALHQLGTRALCESRDEEARRLLQQALDERRALGDKIALRLTQHNFSSPLPLTAFDSSPLRTAPLPKPGWRRRLWPAVVGLLVLGAVVSAARPLAQKVRAYFSSASTPTPTPTLRPTLNPSSLAFDATEVKQQSAPQKVVFNNPQALPLALAALSLSDEAANDFRLTDDACSQTTLPPQSSCSFGLVFVPRAPGMRDATLALKDKAGNSVATLRLRGLAVAPSPTPTPVQPTPAPSLTPTRTATPLPPRTPSPTPLPPRTPSPAPTAAPSPTPVRTPPPTPNLTPTPHPPPALPQIIDFGAQPMIINPGETSRLCYNVTNATSLVIAPDFFQVRSLERDCLTVAPKQTTKYTLLVRGRAGTPLTRTATVIVRTPSPTPPPAGTEKPAGTKKKPKKKLSAKNREVNDRADKR